MRSLTPLALLVMLGVTTPMARAEDDLDLLLGELTFPDTGEAPAAPPAGSARPSNSPEAETPSRRAPLLDPVAVGSPVANAAPQRPRDAGDLRELPPADREQAGDGQMPSEPVEAAEPAEQPPARFQPPVEPLPSSAPEVPAGPQAGLEGSRERGAAVPPAGQSAAGHGAVAPAGDPVRIAAVPADLRRPNLPPPSSLRGYFRSPACYRDVWAGYGHEVHQRCHHYHQHLHGTCDCFDPPYSPPVYHAEQPVDRCACSKCN